jgi:hypothetical protein
MVLHAEAVQTANLRVGEALTKDRKSSAAARDGLVDMARAHVVATRAKMGADGLGCSRVVCNCLAMGMYWADGLQDGRGGVGFGETGSGRVYGRCSTRR